LKMPYYSGFGGTSNEPAIELSHELSRWFAEDGLNRAFFTSGGSDSVESCLRLARQYHKVRGEHGRTKFFSLKLGYHGTHFGGASVNGNNRFRTAYEPLLAGCFHMPCPYPYRNPFNETDPLKLAQQCLQITEDEIIFQGPETIAAFIMEPIIGAGGIIVPHESFMPGIRELCDRYGILLIADEIATGFGRSGALFACNYANVKPDIMCLGKAITGGTMSFAATLTTAEIATSISRGAASCFMRGPTFMANPLAYAVANASLDLLEKNDWKSQVDGLNKGLKQQLMPALKLDYVDDVRVLGAIGVVQVTRAVDLAIIQKLLVEEGVWVRPFGKLVYVMPPYVMTADDLALLCQGMLRALARYFEAEHETNN